MNTKRIVLIATIAALPFAANATQTIVTTQTPTAVGANGTLRKALYVGPYVTNEPTVADQTHIATTAYVKGAYNDSIAAINRLRQDLDGKQEHLRNYDADTGIDSDVADANYFMSIFTREEGYEDNPIENKEDQLVSMAAVGAGLNYVLDNLNEKRVDIYTTWDTNDTTQVQLSNVRTSGNN